jgi:hypothetical protein
LQAPDLAGHIPAAANRLRAVLAGSGHGWRERAAAVLALGSWGQDTTPHLADVNPAVRTCATLPDSCATNPRATAVLLDALCRPAEADGWFPEPLPQFEGWFRFTLLDAALERVESFDDLAPATLALMLLASDYTVDRDWGPLLVKALPGGYRPAAQRGWLRVLADNDACWGNVGNKFRWLRESGLPEQRDDLRRLV